MMAIFIAIIFISVFVSFTSSSAVNNVFENLEQISPIAESESLKPIAERKRHKLYMNANSATDVASSEGNEKADVIFPNRIPKITIWEFPTERRAFIRNKEIFVHSIEIDDSDSHESYFINDVPIVHPHKRKFHDFTNDVNEEKNLPVFRRPDNDSEDPRDLDKLESPEIHGTKLSEVFGYLPSHTHGKLAVEDDSEKSLTETRNIGDEDIFGEEPDINGENWRLHPYFAYIYDYVKELSSGTKDVIP